MLDYHLWEAVIFTPSIGRLPTASHTGQLFSSQLQKRAWAVPRRHEQRVGFVDGLILEYCVKNWVGWYVRIASDRRGFVVVCGCAELSRPCALPSACFYWVCLATPNTDTLTHAHQGIRAHVQQTVTKWNSIHVWMLFLLCFDNSAPVLAWHISSRFLFGGIYIHAASSRFCRRANLGCLVALVNPGPLERRLALPIGNCPACVFVCAQRVFMVLNMQLCWQGDDGDVGDPGPVGQLGVIVSRTASICPSIFLLFFSLSFHCLPIDLHHC